MANSEKVSAMPQSSRNKYQVVVLVPSKDLFYLEDRAHAYQCQIDLIISCVD